MAFPVAEDSHTFHSFYCACCRGTQRFFSFFDHFVCEHCGRRLDPLRPGATVQRLEAPAGSTPNRAPCTGLEPGGGATAR